MVKNEPRLNPLNPGAFQARSSRGPQTTFNKKENLNT